jgi:hypothetical protein
MSDSTRDEGTEHSPATAEPIAEGSATVHEESPGVMGTLTSRLGAAGAKRAIQRRLQRRATAGLMPSAADPEHVRHAAEAATSGAAGSLPHQEAIQRSFGKHDVSSVKAHTDEAAARGAAAMGAEAFASGDRVAFAGSPSLHTAAHEAAHIVQQRSGIHLKGGIGEEGDAYERHADEVADLVVQGRPAESLLDRFAGGDAGKSTAVQHKPIRPFWRKDSRLAELLGSHNDTDEMSPELLAQVIAVMRAIPDMKLTAEDLEKELARRQASSGSTAVAPRSAPPAPTAGHVPSPHAGASSSAPPPLRSDVHEPPSVAARMPASTGESAPRSPVEVASVAAASSSSSEHAPGHAPPGAMAIQERFADGGMLLRTLMAKNAVSEVTTNLEGGEGIGAGADGPAVDLSGLAGDKEKYAKRNWSLAHRDIVANYYKMDETGPMARSIAALADPALLGDRYLDFSAQDRSSSGQSAQQAGRALTSAEGARAHLGRMLAAKREAQQKSPGTQLDNTEINTLGFNSSAIVGFICKGPGDLPTLQQVVNALGAKPGAPADAEYHVFAYQVHEGRTELLYLTTLRPIRA